MYWSRNWALAGVFAVVGAFVAPTEVASAQKFIECVRAYGEGTKTCNCTTFDVTIEVCHEENVAVAGSAGLAGLLPVGGGSAGGSFSVSAATGKSSSTCASAEIPPGTCLWMRYGFECCPESGWLGTYWACKPLANSVQSGPATPADCGAR